MNLTVEHVLLFLVGAFLVYHMMGKCGCNRIEGLPNSYKTTYKKTPSEKLPVFNIRTPPPPTPTKTPSEKLPVFNINTPPPPPTKISDENRLFVLYDAFTYLLNLFVSNNQHELLRNLLIERKNYYPDFNDLFNDRNLYLDCAIIQEYTDDETIQTDVRTVLNEYQRVRSITVPPSGCPTPADLTH